MFNCGFVLYCFTMKRQDIIELAELVRIDFTDDEIARLEKEIPSVLQYVSAVQKIATDVTEVDPGLRRNVLRSDEVVSTKPEDVEALLDSAPVREGRYIKVKKVLNVD